MKKNITIKIGKDNLIVGHYYETKAGHSAMRLNNTGIALIEVFNIAKAEGCIDNQRKRK